MHQAKLAVVMPTFNEMARLPATIAEIVPYLQTKFRDYEIVVVDDNSPDGTANYVRSLNDPKIRVFTQAGRFGKGAAVRRGCLEATGDFILYMDADHATPIQELEHFIPLALQFAHMGPGAIIAGVRTYQEDEGKWRRVLGITAQLIAHLILFKKAVIDSQCGFKLFPNSIAKYIFGLSKTNGGMIDAEIFHLMHLNSIRVYYAPVHWKNKPGSRINVLACMIRDPIELVRIRFRGMLGMYAGGPLPKMEPISAPESAKESQKRAS